MLQPRLLRQMPQKPLFYRDIEKMCQGLHLWGTEGIIILNSPCYWKIAKAYLHKEKRSRLPAQMNVGTTAKSAQQPRCDCGCLERG